MNNSVLFIPSVSNPYFHILKTALTNNGCDVCSDINEFWNPSKHYDILHVHFPEFLNGFGNSKLKYKQRKKDNKTVQQLRYFKKSGTKVVWSALNIKGHEQKYYGEKNLVYHEISKICHGIITLGPSYHNFLKKVYPNIKEKPLTVIPHGNLIDSYPNDISRIDSRRLLNIKESKTVLIFFGLQRKYKNIYFIYKVFKKASKNNKNIQLLIAGSPWGFKRKVFMKFLDIFYPNIIIKPHYISDNEIQIYFNASDIAIFSFKNMITSGSVILAQSFGVPVVVPNIGCFPDIVPKSSGFMYENNNIDSCVKVIQKCLNSDLKRMGKNAKAQQELISWNQIGLQTKSFYNSVMHK